jgi:hypothetical protein
MIAYLDTNAFDHLYKKIGCTAADIANLRKRIYGHELSIRPSIHILADILRDRRARPELLVARIKLTLSLASFRQMVKPCAQLIADDVRSYAARGTADRPYISADLQNTISDGISELIETDGEELDEDMVAAFEAERSQPQRLRELLARETKVDHPKSLDEYFQTELPRALEACASNTGMLEGCRSRGIDGLREVRSIRAATSAVLSLEYGRSLDGLDEKETQALDLRHVPCAAAVADTFVTDDRNLRQALSRVPLDNFEVIDLPDFLARVRQ